MRDLRLGYVLPTSLLTNIYLRVLLLVFTLGRIMNPQNRFPRSTGEFEFSQASADSLTLEFGPFEVVHKWKRMQECNEFVGTRY